MIKRLFFLYIGLFISAFLIAEPISKEEALEKASSFMKQKMMRKTSSGMKLVYSAPKLSKAAENAYYYIFNINDGQGFVIVSGDDRTVPVLGYTDSGSYDPDNLPDNFRAWMQGYADAIEYLDKKDVKQKANPAITSGVISAIAPLVKTKWNQGSPYNNKCPILQSTGEAAATGCAATAMAQVMKYYEWPKSATTSLPGYTTRTQEINIPSLPSVVLDWNNMNNTYSGSETDVQTNAVAELMYYCGVSIHMDYDRASGAVSADIADALKEYFDYDARTKHVDRGNYTLSEWKDLIYKELKEKRIVLYHGQSSGGGHAFVCDGCDGDGLFHINWGWGGTSDGYFELSVLNPDNNTSIGSSSSSDGYSFAQGAIIGIQRNTGVADDEAPRLTVSDMALVGDGVYTRSSINDKFVDISFTHNFYNEASDTYSFCYGIGIQDGETVYPLLRTEEAVEFGPGTGWFPYKWEFSLNFPVGEYKLVPICKEANAEEWSPAQASGLNYILASVTETELKLSVVSPDLAANSVAFPGVRLAGYSQSVTANITNSGQAEFYGPLYLWVSQQNTKPNRYTSLMGVTIPGNATQDVSLSFTPSVAGTYYVWITTDYRGRDVLAEGNVEIMEASGSPEISVTSCEVEGLNTERFTNVLYGNTIKLNVTLENKGSVFADNVTALLWSNNQNAGQATMFRSIGSGETVTCEFLFDNMEIGKKYDVYIFAPEQIGFSQASFTTRPALTTWKADGTKQAVKPENTITVPDDVVAVDLSGLTYDNIVTNDNPNCLYFLDTAASIPANLQGKNLILGSSAAKIVLTDNQYFYCPKEFVADEISYSRTISRTSDGKKGWETIVLPFNATSIRNVTDNAWLTLLISDDDNSGDVCLKEFCGTGNNDAIYFDYAKEIQANTPYIISIPQNKQNLINKSITFSAADAVVTVTDQSAVASNTYKFIGEMREATLTGAYVLNSEGSAFTKRNNAKTDPFRAYFTTAVSYNTLITSLGIDGVSDASDVRNTLVNELIIYRENDKLIIETLIPEVIDIYGIDGTKVRSIHTVTGRNEVGGLSHGIYLVKGHKVLM